LKTKRKAPDYPLRSSWAQTMKRKRKGSRNI